MLNFCERLLLLIFALIFSTQAFCEDEGSFPPSEKLFWDGTLEKGKSDNFGVFVCNDSNVDRKFYLRFEITSLTQSSEPIFIDQKFTPSIKKKSESGSDCQMTEFTWLVPENLTVNSIDIRGSLYLNDSLDQYLGSFVDGTHPIFEISDLILTNPEESINHQVSVGQEFSIEWRWQGEVGNKVKIELFKESTPISIIAESTDNDGEFDWIVPSDLDFYDPYFIKITDSNNPNISSLGGIKVIPLEYILITAPSNKASLYKGVRQTFHWEQLSFSGIYKFTLTNLEGEIVFEALDIADNKYDFDVPKNIPSGNYIVLVSDSNNQDVFDDLEVFINDSPKITIKNPINGSSFLAGNTVNIEWESNFQLDSIELQLRAPGKTPLKLFSSNENPEFFSWLIPIDLPPNETYSLFFVTNVEHLLISGGTFAIYSPSVDIKLIQDRQYNLQLNFIESDFLEFPLNVSLFTDDHDIGTYALMNKDSVITIPFVNFSTLIQENGTYTFRIIVSDNNGTVVSETSQEVDIYTDVVPPDEGDDDNPNPNDTSQQDIDTSIGSNQQGSDTSQSVEDPVNVAFGNYYYQKSLISMPSPGGALSFDIGYDTLRAEEDSVIGFGWRHNWEIHLYTLSDDVIRFDASDGKTYYFNYSHTNSDGKKIYEHDIGALDAYIEAQNDDDYLLFFGDGTSIYFDHSIVTGVSDRYDFVQITEVTGRRILADRTSDGISRLKTNWGDLTIIFSYYGSKKLSKVEGPEAQVYEFTYDNLGNLSEYRDPHYVADSTKGIHSFTYNGHLLETATDPSDKTYLQNEYDTEGRVIKQWDAKDQLSEFTYIDTSDTHTTIVTDREGHQTTYLHDQNYRLTEISQHATDRNGVVSELKQQFRWDEENNLITAIDARGNVVNYEYDEKGNKRFEISAFGTTEWQYDENSNVLYRKDRDGAEWRFTYDTKNNLETQTDPLGRISTFAYNSYSQLTRLIDPKGNTTYFVYDENGNRSCLRDAVRYKELGENCNSEDWNWLFDDAGRVTRKIDPVGNQTKWDYTAKGWVNSITAADTGVVGWNYNKAGKAVEVIDQAGNIIGLLHDKNELISEITYPSGRQLKRNYDKNDRQIDETKPGDRKTKYDYDELGRVIRKTLTGGELTQKTEYEYDANSNLTKEVVFDGDEFFTTEHKYDKANRRTQTIAPDGGSTYFYYDEMNRLEEIIDADTKRVFKRTFDFAGQLKEEINGEGDLTKYDYDNAGNLQFMYRYPAEGTIQTTEYKYDANNRLVETIDAMGGISKTSYDLAGRKSSQIDPEGVKTRFEYDSMGRLKAIIDGAENSQTYLYNLRGLLDTFTNARGEPINFKYTADQQLEQEIRPGSTIVFGYNGIGELTSKSFGTNKLSYSYDSLGRLSSRTGQYGRTVKYAYNQRNLINQIVYSDNSSKVGYDYDLNSRLKTVTDWNGHTTQYAYSKAGSLQSISKPDGSIAAFNYDNAQQLLRKSIGYANSQPLASWHYTLDNIGKRIGADVFEPLPPQPTLTAEFSYENTLGQQEKAFQQVQNYDADGNMTKGWLNKQLQEFDYNSLNQLTKVTAANDEVFNLVYDLDGNRVSSGITGQEHQYVIDTLSPTNKVLEEWQGNKLVARYVWGLGLISSELGATHTYRVYHFDTRGSTVVLTSLQGNLTDAYTYDTYGELQLALGQSHNPFTYNGRDGVMREQNGLYYMKTRFFNPDVKRFVNKDILLGDAIESQSMNRYGYVIGDPISYIDPLGMENDEDNHNKVSAEQWEYVNALTDENESWLAKFIYVILHSIESDPLVILDYAQLAELDLVHRKNRVNGKTDNYDFTIQLKYHSSNQGDEFHINRAKNSGINSGKWLEEDQEIINYLNENSKDIKAKVSNKNPCLDIPTTFSNIIYTPDGDTYEGDVMRIIGNSNGVHAYPANSALDFDPNCKR